MCHRKERGFYEDLKQYFSFLCVPSFLRKTSLREFEYYCISEVRRRCILKSIFFILFSAFCNLKTTSSLFLLLLNSESYLHQSQIVTLFLLDDFHISQLLQDSYVTSLISYQTVLLKYGSDLK